MAELIAGAGEVWTKLLSTDAPWVLVGTTKSIVMAHHGCECGHPAGNHGDRAIAACVPDGIDYRDHWDNTDVPPRCYCAGWRAVK